MASKISATLFSDPSCPWAYSENPALRVLEWRYREQLDWELVMVGLSEDPGRYLARGGSPGRSAQRQTMYRGRYGMPFGTLPKPRLSASSLACRAVVAVRLRWPGREWLVFRTLQFANFNTTLLLDERAALREVLAGVPELDADAVIEMLEAPEVLAAYETDKARTRSAAGSATELQGKAADTDGSVRYTAPSVVFESPDGRRLEAGGFQTVEAYDVLVANLDPTLSRHAPPGDLADALTHFEFGLTTQELAAIATHGNDPVDLLGAERALIGLVAEGRAQRHPLGSDAVWTLPGAPPPLDLSPARPANRNGERASQSS